MPDPSATTTPSAPLPTLSGDITQFVRQATSALAQGVADDRLRLTLIQRLAQAGLHRRALSFAGDLSDEVAARPELAQSLRVLEASPNDGIIPWHLFSGRFAQNLRVLQQTCDFAERVEAAWHEAREHLELHQAATGQRVVFDRRLGQGGDWRPVFGDFRPQPSLKQLTAQFRGGILSPLVLDGVGLGDQLPWLYEASVETFLGASTRIYVVEPSYLGLAVALHLQDWRAPCTSGRVVLCVGPTAYDQFEERLKATPWLALPTFTVRPPPWEPTSGDSAEKRIAAAANHLTASYHELRREVERVYAGRDAAWWAGRFAAARAGAQPPLRVLGITSRFTTVLQYSMRDALAAFAAQGCETHTLIEPDDCARMTPFEMLKATRAFEPDLVLMIDHTRQKHAAGLIDNVPVVAWIQDRLDWLFNRDVGAALGPLDFCMGFCRRELVERYSYPADRFLQCEMGTSPAVLGADRDAAPDSRFVCDVAYATNRNRVPEKLHAEHRRLYGDEHRPLCDAIYEELRARLSRNELNAGLDLDHFVRLLEEHAGKAIPEPKRHELIENYVRPLVDQLLREQTVAWTAAWAERTGHRFHLYGHGWNQHPQYARFARGFVAHGPELGAAIRGAAINLHAGCNRAFHQRMLDGLAARGFFLLRRHADDVEFWTARRVYEAAAQRGLHCGDTMALEDLPGGLRDEWAAFRRMRGFDPATPYTLLREPGDELARDPATLQIPICVWRDLDDFTFDSERELSEKLDGYLAHPEERAARAASLRERMLAVFGYEGLMSRLGAWLAEALTRSARAEQIPSADDGQ